MKVEKIIIRIVLLTIYFMWQLILPAQYYGRNSEESWRKSRDENVKPEILLNKLSIKPGMIIGEAGAGAGYLTYYLAKRVAEKGHIYANDILALPLENLKKYLNNAGIENYTTVLGQDEDPLFPVKNLDMIVMLHAYHEFNSKVRWLINSKKYIKPDGAIVILDSRDDDGREITRREVETEAGKAGYNLSYFEEYNKIIKIFILKPIVKSK